MSFKLAFKSMKKNMKDYVIYFLTLILGVALFYIFNSMDSQQAMLEMSDSKMQIMQLMTEMLGIVSIFVSFILGFLIVYANNFLIKRRKKEFGLYMLLGMGKRKISKILLIETLLIGLFSLGIGLVIGVFASQLMSILVSKMFEANMTEYQFAFSKAALVKTIVYFAAIYLFVMIMNIFTTSKYKLIDLLTANKKNEKIKIKNPIISVILFIVSVAILAAAYYLAITKITGTTATGIIIAIGLGCLGTILFFYSLSGFILKLVQSRRNIYEKNLNIFVLRQIDSKINTTVFSMSVICILLFLTICIFSSAMSLNNTMTTQLKEYTPVDATFEKPSNIKEGTLNIFGKPYTKEQIESSKISIIDTLKQTGFNSEDKFKEVVQTYTYTTDELIMENTLVNIKEKLPMLNVKKQEPIMKISEYNKIAKLFNHEELTLNQDEYIILCNYGEMKVFRDEALKNGITLSLNGTTLKPKYQECKEAFISNSAQAMELGVFIVADNVVKEEWKQKEYLNVNYQGETEEEKAKVEEELVSLQGENDTVNALELSDITALTRISLYDASKGLSATVIFLGLYLGVVFLISSSAILALKELTDSSDNKERYNILRKIGADEKMINKALFKQIAIFYLIPLALAIIHSIFGLKVASIILSMFGKQDAINSIILTAIFLVTIYGGYFVATYFGSKNIIKE